MRQQLKNSFGGVTRDAPRYVPSLTSGPREQGLMWVFPQRPEPGPKNLPHLADPPNFSAATTTLILPHSRRQSHHVVKNPEA